MKYFVVFYTVVGDQISGRTKLERRIVKARTQGDANALAAEYQRKAHNRPKTGLVFGADPYPR